MKNALCIFGCSHVCTLDMPRVQNRKKGVSLEILGICE